MDEHGFKPLSAWSTQGSLERETGADDAVLERDLGRGKGPERGFLLRALVRG